jgi:short-subunit dehydrogenase
MPKITLKPLKQQVMVITGATSGIGLATAKAAAQAGVRLVLNARSAADLDRVAGLLGGPVLTVAGDMADPTTAARLAETAHARFGGFDTWVNNAGVGMWGWLADGNLEDFKKLFDNNLWSLVNGSLEAVKHLQQHGGALLNVGSVVSDVAAPLQGMYATSKHAIKGFTDSLRIELAMQKAPVSVTLIRPAGIGTPFPDHARNYLPNQATLPSPLYAPEEVAYAILQAAASPQREVFVGGVAKLLSAVRKQVPALLDAQLAKMTSPASLVLPGTPTTDPAGSLYASSAPHAAVRSPTLPPQMKTSYYTRASLHPALTATLAAGLLAGVAALVAARRRR